MPAPHESLSDDDQLPLILVGRDDGAPVLDVRVHLRAHPDLARARRPPARSRTPRPGASSRSSRVSRLSRCGPAPCSERGSIEWPVRCVKYFAVAARLDHRARRVVHVAARAAAFPRRRRSRTSAIAASRASRMAVPDLLRLAPTARRSSPSMSGRPTRPLVAASFRAPRGRSAARRRRRSGAAARPTARSADSPRSRRPTRSARDP